MPRLSSQRKKATAGSSISQEEAEESGGERGGE
jgi:hypothetical protein